MGLGALGSNLLTSVTGNTDKAILCIKKAQPAGKGLLGLTGGKKLTPSELQTKLAGSSKGLFSSLFSAAQKTAEGAGYHVMKVDYNPTKIQFLSNDGVFMEPGPGGAGTNAMTQVVVPPQTYMVVELTFDDVNNQDAFMFDKITNTSTGAMVSNVAGAVKNIAGKGYSIKPKVEALIGMLTQQESRDVVFYWSDLSFAGEVTEVSANYTMFNPLGHPVRGTVQLVIRQSGSDAAETKYWLKAYYNMDTGGGKLDTITGAVGNVLNLK